MTLSPTERKELLALIAANLTERMLQEYSMDALATVDLATAGQMIGLGPKAAAEKLPVIEVGPRTRRVSLADLKAYQEANKRFPKNWQRVRTSNPESVAA